MGHRNSTKPLLTIATANSAANIFHDRNRSSSSRRNKGFFQNMREFQSLLGGSHVQKGIFQVAGYLAKLGNMNSATHERV